jgi:hypothetical protein
VAVQHVDSERIDAGMPRGEQHIDNAPIEPGLIAHRHRQLRPDALVSEHRDVGAGVDGRRRHVIDADDLAACAGAARRGTCIVDVTELSPEPLAHPGVALDAQSAV